MGPKARHTLRDERLRRTWAFVQPLFADRLRLVLLLVLAWLACVSTLPLSGYAALVDWPTIAALTGLLALTQGLEHSAALQRASAGVIDRVATERGAALVLVAGSALLSTLLTNDVALFVVVPLTLALCRATGLPVARWVIFEALAVNAGSALTPVGNPQNLFLWQLSGVSFARFVACMLPLTAALMLLLLALTVWAFPARPLRRQPAAAAAPLDRPLLVLVLLLYLPFIIAADLHQAAWAVGVVLLLVGLLRPRVLLKMDWGLLCVFVLMFVDMRLLAGLGLVQRGLAGLRLQDPAHLYFTGIAASQFISNVPATIALAASSKHWQVLAWSVNIGGFGSVLGSLANLIALRLAADRQAWWRFHLYSVPALAIAGVIGYSWLFG